MPVPAVPRRLPLDLAAALALAAAASLALGQDANWDLLNYHLYAPWAWWTGRVGHDLAPALQAYHNPLADLPFYAMVAAQWPPQAIAAALALPAGVAGCFAWRLAGLAFGARPRPLATAAVVAATAIGVTGPNARALLGTTMNEWHAAALLMPALWVVARDLQAGTLRPRAALVAGVLAGAACGLKLTAAGYALAIAVALPLALGPRDGARPALLYAAAVAAGLAATAGPWMATMHALTGNPLFPYFNAAFGAPLLPADWRFPRSFGPQAWWQWLALPFDLVRPPQGYVSEQRYRDARYALVALGALALAIAAWRARRRGRGGPPWPPLARFGAAFWAAAFVLWVALHGIHRYLLLLEVLSGIALVAAALALLPARRRVAGVLVLAVLVIATTRAPSWWRVPFGEAFVTVEAPAIAPGTLVLLHGAPLTFVLPFLPPDARHAGIANGLVDARASGLRRQIAEAVAAQRGPLALLRLRGADASVALASFGLVHDGACTAVASNLARMPIELCPLARR